MKLYIINGKAGSGKDTFCKMIWDIIPQWGVDRAVVTLHSSDPAKEALTSLGWNGEKTSEMRQLLAELTKFSQSNGMSDKMINQYSKAEVVFFHERDPREIARLKSSIYPEPKTILIKRDSEQLEFDMWDIEKYDYDIVIDNSGTLDQLKERAEQFCREENLI